MPLLDTRLIRLVVSVPAIPWCQHKTLPRQAYRGRLPATVLERPKTPLDGFNEAFVAEWRHGNGGRLTTPASPSMTWVDLREWARRLESRRAGGRDGGMARQPRSTAGWRHVRAHGGRGVDR